MLRLRLPLLALPFLLLAAPAAGESPQERLAASLVAVADHGNRPAVEQGRIGIVIEIEPAHGISWR